MCYINILRRDLTVCDEQEAQLKTSAERIESQRLGDKSQTELRQLASQLNDISQLKQTNSRQKVNLLSKKADLQLVRGSNLEKLSVAKDQAKKLESRNKLVKSKFFVKQYHDPNAFNTLIQ